MSSPLMQCTLQKPSRPTVLSAFSFKHPAPSFNVGDQQVILLEGTADFGKDVQHINCEVQCLLA